MARIFRPKCVFSPQISEYRCDSEPGTKQVLGEDSGPMVETGVWGWGGQSLGPKGKAGCGPCWRGAEAGEERISAASERKLGEVKASGQEEELVPAA